MSRGRWYSRADDARIKELLDQGFTVKMIAKELGRSYGSVSTRKKKLNLHASFTARRLKMGMQPLPRGQRTFKRRIWTEEQDMVIRTWTEDKLNVTEARKICRCHTYYLYARALELGLSIPPRYRVARVASTLQEGLPVYQTAKPGSIDGQPYTCTVGLDPLLAALKSAHPERVPS